jgi:serine protease Do
LRGFFLPSARLHRRRLRPAVAAACCLALGASVAKAADTDGAQVLDAIQHQVLDLFEKCRSAVVRVEGADTDGRLFGTGFFIDPNGTLYTSYSVGGETHDLVVTLGDAKHPARRLIADARAGIAILKIDAQTPFLTFGKSRDLRTASPVLTIGYPMDLSVTPSFGIVGGFDLRYLGRYFATAHIRANVPVQRGQGGAPLLNMKGEVVGVLISSIDNGSASFVLPIEAAEKVRRDFVRFQEVRPGWMGIAVGPSAPGAPDTAPVIQGLAENSPGAKANLLPGDIVVQLGEYPVTSEEDVLSASYYLTAEDEVKVSVLRNGQRMDLKIQPVDHPQFHRQPSRLPTVVGATNDLSLSGMDLER